MPTIPITDGFNAEVDLESDSKSEAGQLGLQSLRAKTRDFLTAAGKPLDEAGLKTFRFDPGFQSPAIGLGGGLQIQLAASAGAAVSIYTQSDKTLFPPDEVSPPVAIADTDCWVGFEVDGALGGALGVASPSGFGVSGAESRTARFLTYSCFHREGAAFPSLKSGVERALVGFQLVRDASVLRAQPMETVNSWEAGGSFTVSGSYALPLSVNRLSLAATKLPFGQEGAIGPEAVLQVSGALKVSGEFEGRCYRLSPEKLQLGLYKKRETDLSASLAAEAGLGAKVGTTDLIGVLFSALPQINLKPGDLPEEDAERMGDALKSALGQGLSISLNACCTAAVSNEAAVLYEVDLQGGAGPTDAALNAALQGDWRPLGALPNARELRNLVKQTATAKYKTTLNLLGVYDYASLDDFVRSCAVLHNVEDGSVTITDQETAKRIAAAAMPFIAKDDQLRRVLAEAFVATAVYTASGAAGQLGTSLEAKQTLLIYKSRAGREEVRKALLLGASLGLLSATEIDAAADEDSARYVRFEAGADFRGQDALCLFFSDPNSRTPREAADVKRIGRQVLASLLDPNLGVDNRRRQILADDSQWARLESQQFPSDSPGSYSDWYDITFWADAVAGVGPYLKAVLDALDGFSGPDPSKDQNFMAQRERLSKAVADVAKKAHAAFEKGWPIAVMYALSGRRAPVSFRAYWDGGERISRQAGLAAGGSG